MCPHTKSTQETGFGKRVSAIILAMAVLFTPVLALADEESESYDGILVENAYIETSPDNPKPVLKLNISNFSPSNLTLTGVEAEPFENSTMLIKLPDTGLAEVKSLSILQEETLAFDSSHLFVVLSDLKRALKDGEKVELELKFRRQTIRAVADVHFSHS